MKQLLLLITLLSCSLLSSGQKLWGITYNGGEPSQSRGTIFTTDPDGSNYEVKHAFKKHAGNNPYRAKLTVDDEGYLVGAVGSAIFRYNPTTREYKYREPFGTSGLDARNPWCGITISSGIFYGTTVLGGANGEGAIFRYNPNFGHFEVSYNFDLSTGEFSNGTMAGFGSNLYGVTTQGGLYDQGVLYHYNTSGSFTKLVDFKEDSLGKFPICDLLLDGDKLFGTTTAGGKSRTEGQTGNGTVFMYDLTNDTIINVLDSLVPSVTGVKPGGGLIKATDGKYYGVMENGGSLSRGLIYSLDPVTFEQTIIYDFNAPLLPGRFFPDRYPTGSLLEASNGKLYGMANGGADNKGIVYSYDLSADTFTVEIEFNGTNGTRSTGAKNSLIEAPNGMIYGMTSQGGKKDDGVIFSLNPATGESKVEIDFGRDDGNDPEGGLLKAGNGKLYDVAIRGGSENEGTLFEYDPFNEEFNVVHEFGLASDGKFPNSPLTEGSDGLIYGTTQEYSATGDGTVFSYNPATGEYLRRVNMGQYTEYDDLYNPFGGLVEYSPGEFYGTTLNASAIYSYNSITDVLTTEKVLTKTTEGEKIRGTLLKASDDKLYGLATKGGSNNNGTLFSFDPATDNFELLHTFDAITEGVLYQSSLMQASDGKLYATANNDGSGGLIFSYDIVNDVFAIEHAHTDEALGSALEGTLTQLPNGKLVGMTESDGVNNNGTVFEFDIETKDYSVITEFDNFNGRNPRNGQMLYYQVPVLWNGEVWSNGVGPESTDIAEINANYTIGIEETLDAKSLTISSDAVVTTSGGSAIDLVEVLENNGEIIMEPFSRLTVGTDIANFGSILLESGSSLITYDDHSVTGNPIEIRRETRYADGKYSFVSSPVVQNASITGSDLGSHVYKYNEAASSDPDALSRWVPASADQLIPGRGYTQANQQLLAFEGVPNSGTINYTASATNDGYHLVGNPYPAAIDVDAFIDGNSATTETIYIWDDNGSDTGRGSNSDYIVVTKSGATDNNGPDSEARWNGHIGSMQGFFVQMDGSAGTVSFTEDMRVSGRNSDFNYFRTDNSKTPLVRVNLTNEEGLFKQAVVAWNNEVSNTELAKGYDGKVFGTSGVNMLYTMKGEHALAIQTITREKEIIPLTYQVDEAGVYTLSIDLRESNGQSLLLRDKHSEEVIDLSSESYSFNSADGQFNDRFELLTNARVLGLDERTIQVYAHDQTIYINQPEGEERTYQLLSIDGQQVFTRKLRSSTEIQTNLLPGVYIITDGEQSHKIILK